ncbi:MAG TPA: sigma factor, partial [Candidatus Dormibacteraeota bacterium]|nr:sigma factor [Candidatus Dormibacteraeota bacterium]
MHVPFTSDEALVEEAREGARLAFETLIQPLISPAYRLALVMVRDPSQAEDCVQEAALRAWRARAQLRGGAEGLRPWFLAIVANECRNWLRGRWIRVLRRDLPPLATESGP